MPLHSPIFGSPFTAAGLFAIGLFLFWASRTLDRRSRSLLRAAVLLLLISISGLDLRCDRPLDIVVAVDVSPSTRSATFRDPQSVAKKIDHLLAGRRYRVQYFADGPATTADEPTVNYTRLPDITADAIVLMSDGRFDLPGDLLNRLPPVFVAVDPALDAPADSAVRSLVAGGRGVTAEVTVASTPANFTITGVDRPTVVTERGGQTFSSPARGGSVTARIKSTERPPESAPLPQVDYWPENNALSLELPQSRVPLPWLVRGSNSEVSSKTSAEGFAAKDVDKLPLYLSDYLDPPAVIVDSAAPVAVAKQQLLLAYVRDLGGTVVLIGSPATWPVELAAAAPLRADPPTGDRRWTVLLDASGSMSAPVRTPAPDKAQTRWTTAVSAARGAVDALPERSLVSVAKFSNRLFPASTSVTKKSALAALDQLARASPNGPTDLQNALLTVAGANADRITESPDNLVKEEATVLLLITDADASIPDPQKLERALLKANIRLYLLATAAVPPGSSLPALATATGGRMVTSTNPAEWSKNALDLLRSARGPDLIATNVTADGTGALAGVSIAADSVYAAYPARGSAISAATKTTEAATPTASEKPVPIIADWRVGSGRIVSIAADLSAPSLRAVVQRYRSSPSDPRLTVDWQRDHVIVTAVGNGRPINGLDLRVRVTTTPTALSTSPTPTPFDDSPTKNPVSPADTDAHEHSLEQIAPGKYYADLARSPVPAAAVLLKDGLVVARRARPADYAREFDQIGNDTTELQNLASSTGGKLLLPGETTAIDWPTSQRVLSLRKPLTLLALLLLLAFIRLPRRS